MVVLAKLSLFKSRTARRILLPNAGYPSFLIISWENTTLKSMALNYYYSLLIDATTELILRSVNYDSVKDQPCQK